MQEQKQQGFDLVGKSLMIGLPAYDHKVTAKMAISLMKLSQDVLQHGINIQVSLVAGCSVVSRARNLVVYEFLQSKCDHLLFIDSDMTFEPESVLRLLAWNQDRAIVAGAYEARKEGKVFILTLDGGPNGEVIMDQFGLVKARRVATGFMMIHRRVFEGLAEKHPEWYHQDHSSPAKLYSFFDFLTTPDGYMGEDFLFCKRAEEAGFDIWIDPTIKLGHMGVHEFRSDFGNEVLYPKLDALIRERSMSEAA